MREIFNFRRFGLYFIKTVLERPTQILGTFALSFSVVILIFFLLKSMGHFDVAQLLSFTTGLVGGGCLLASLVFGYFSDMAIGASYLTLPVSTLEKWLCATLLVGLYLGCFLLFFRGLDSFFVHLYHGSLNKQDARYKQQFDSVYIFRYFDESLEVFVFFLNAATAMLVGALYFNKVSFIKVALVICSLYFFTFFLNYLIGSFLFKDLIRSFPFHNVSIQNSNEMGVLVMPSRWNRLNDAIVIYILPAILLIVSYIRLKEKEI
jgi:hypothetical protein